MPAQFREAPDSDKMMMIAYVNLRLEEQRMATEDRKNSEKQQPTIASKLRR